MVNPSLNYCIECSNVSGLLLEIDNKLAYYGKNQINNIKLLTCLDYNIKNVGLLIFYKRILNYRLFNSSYACTINIEDIISRIKILLSK